MQIKHIYKFFIAIFLFAQIFLFIPQETQAVACTARVNDQAADAARGHKPVCQPNVTTRDACNNVCLTNSGIWVGCQLYEINDCNSFENLFDNQGGYTALNPQQCGVNNACPSQVRTSTATVLPAQNNPTSQTNGTPDGYTGPLPDCAFSGTCRDVNALVELIINIGKYILSILGSLAFLMFIYGGLTMILSFGSPEKFKKGQGVLIAAVVGVMISLSAYLAIDFVLDSLQVADSFRVVK